MQYRLLIGSAVCLVLMQCAGCFAGPGIDGKGRAPKIVKLLVNGNAVSSSTGTISIISSQKVHFACDVEDPDGDPLKITWSSSVPSGATPSPTPSPSPTPAPTPAPAAATRAEEDPTPQPTSSPTPVPQPSLEAQQQFDWDSGVTLGNVFVTCTVTDGEGHSDAKSVALLVKKEGAQ